MPFQYPDPVPLSEHLSPSPTSPGPELTTLELADIISTVEFDHTGNYLATGDKGGRVVLFERNETVSSTTCDVMLGTDIDLITEEDLRVQIPYRIPVARTRIRLPQIPRDRREDQQDQVVPTTECLTLPALYK